MKITGIQAIPLSLRLPPGATVTMVAGSTTKRAPFIVRVQIDEGLTGHGEALPGRCPGGIALGDQVDIPTDANTAYTTNDVRFVLPVLADIHAGWPEESFACQDFASYRAAARLTQRGAPGRPRAGRGGGRRAVRQVLLHRRSGLRRQVPGKFPADFQ